MDDKPNKQTDTKIVNGKKYFAGWEEIDGKWVLVWMPLDWGSFPSSSLDAYRQ